MNGTLIRLGTREAVYNYIARLNAITMLRLLAVIGRDKFEMKLMVD